MRVFIYLRVSTDDQEDNTSLEQQEIDCRKYCEINGYIVAGVYKDVYTGSVWRERKGFMEMRSRYLRGEGYGVVVRTYSRFTRMIAHYYVLTEEMKESNVQLFCVKEKYDNTVIGRMLQRIQMGFNEQERKTIRQRTIDGKKARVTNKKQYLAGKKPPYGYRFDNEKTKGKLVVYEEEAEVVRTIIRMRSERKGIFFITKYLIENNIPTPSGGSAWNERTVRIIVERAKDMYRGIAYAYKYEFTTEYRNGKKVIVKHKRPENEQLLLPEGTVPRIIDDETALLALVAATINTQEASRNNQNVEDALLRSGHIKCGQCGAAMTMHRRGGRYKSIIYRCSGVSRAANTCHMEISTPKIDVIAWNYVHVVLEELEFVENAVNAVLDHELSSLSEKAAVKTIEDCKALIEQYRQDLQTTGLSKSTRSIILEDMGKQIDLQEQLEIELEAIQTGIINRKQVVEEYHNFVNWCRNFKKNEIVTYKEKRDALRFLGVVVYIFKEDAPQGRYNIRLAPPDLMQALKIVPKIEGGIGETLSDQVHRVRDAYPRPLLSHQTPLAAI